MFAYTQCFLGLLVIHVGLLIAYVVGSFLLAAKESRPFGGLPILEVALAIAVGVAAIGILSFFAGMVALLTPIGFILTIVTACTVGAVLSPRSRELAYWRERVGLLKEAFLRPGLLVLWAVLIVMSFPAEQPAMAPDAVFYHQVYALEWAQHHRIFVDPLRRFPYYASNWLLIDVWFEVFGLGCYAQFAGWASGALAAVLAYGLVLKRLPSRTWGADLAAACACLPFMCSPTLFHWGNSGMVDVAMGSAFMFAAVVATANMLAPERRTTIAAVLIGGFFLGMKPTLPAFFPLLALLLVGGVRAAGGTWRSAAVTVVCLALLASPWYARNIILDGDPAPPLLHMALHRDDLSFTLADTAAMAHDLRSDKSPANLALLPIRMFFSPETIEFREVGTTLVVLFIPAAFLVLASSMFRRRIGEASLWALALVTAYGYWILTDHLGRYSLLFYPLLTVFVLRCFVGGAERLRARPGWALFVPSATAIAVVSAFVCAEPTPSSLLWLRVYIDRNYVYGANAFPSNDAFLAAYMPQYLSEKATIAWIDQHPAVPRRVYAFNLGQFNYSFAENHIESIGDWVGPERYTDFMVAARTNHLGDFLGQFDVSVTLIPNPNVLFPPPDLARMESQLRANGFHLLQTVSAVDIFVRN